MVSAHKPTAMILAAGRGTRMGALGEKYPKALLKVNGTPLIQYHIEKLSASGFSRIIINVSHLATQIKQFITDQYCSGPEIIFSEENTPLETAGGVAAALKHINRDIFPVINADIYSELPFERLNESIATLKKSTNNSGYLFMVPNPAHNLEGDFCLTKRQLQTSIGKKVTFSGIGVYRAKMFRDVPKNTSAPLAPILKHEINRGHMLGELITEFWSDAGTQDRLQHINQFISARSQ